MKQFDLLKGSHGYVPRIRSCSFDLAYRAYRSLLYDF